jgi:aconitate hydratase
MKSKNSFNAISEINVNHKIYKYFSLRSIASTLGFDLSRLPYSLKVLLENALRFEDGKINDKSGVNGFVDWLNNNGKTTTEIGFMPSRVLMQDFTGVPAIVDLAAMRDALQKLGGDPERINPLIPVDLVIDHSVQVDVYGSSDAFKQNAAIEMGRNQERYEFLRWGASAFNNFRVVPPGTGICHQINIEYLAKVVHENDEFAYPDTLVGTDSHTTMVNSLGVLGWGVGGIEAEAAMLGQPLPMVIPEVIGVELKGQLKDGINATDLVLTITQMLRKANVVGKFVEFYGSGLKNLSLADRATVANMAPEYGATCGFFPIDDETLKYLELTSRNKYDIDLVSAYAREQGLWHDEKSAPLYSWNLSLDLDSVEISISGPKRPQDRMRLSEVRDNFIQTVAQDIKTDHVVQDKNYSIRNGSIVIAAITSCTNTSNPYVMIGAGLVAKKIVERGIKTKPWVKASLAPGSLVVTQYLKDAGLDAYLDELGFNLVGYGCTTCIGNSGPLLQEIEDTIAANNLQVAAVLSGNRNFEGRVHPFVKANYLASPMLVVAYAVAGSIDIDIENEPLGVDMKGASVFLKDVWPTRKEIDDCISQSVQTEFFEEKYNDVFTGSAEWQALEVDDSKTYSWKKSTYINNPPYFTSIKALPDQFQEIKQARILAVFGDSITTDHISPAGNISKKSPAASYLLGEGVPYADFNSYGARRGNHEVMMRGTFANIRIKNELCKDLEGGFAKSISGEVKSIYDAAMEYKAQNIPLVIIAGKEYGTGSSRDWAAKGTFLLGVKAVIAESFERIHRSNLVGMGVLPLKFLDGMTRHDLALNGSETIDIILNEADFKPHQQIKCIINSSREINLELQVFTEIEVEYLKHGTILHKVIRGEL